MGLAMRRRARVTSDHIRQLGESPRSRRLLASCKKFALCERKVFAIRKVFTIMGQFRERKLSVVRLSLPVPVPGDHARGGDREDRLRWPGVDDVLPYQQVRIGAEANRVRHNGQPSNREHDDPGGPAAGLGQPHRDPQPEPQYSSHP
jgi:hypothetical protein